MKRYMPNERKEETNERYRLLNPRIEPPLLSRSRRGPSAHALVTLQSLSPMTWSASH
jgi:hypothetical protein